VTIRPFAAIGEVDLRKVRRLGQVPCCRDTGIDLAENDGGATVHLAVHGAARMKTGRSGTARQFPRDAQRVHQSGHDAADVEYVERQSDIDSVVMESEQTVIAQSGSSSKTGRLGTHAIAAIFVILLAAFGVFCSYYPWKIPPVAPQKVVSTNTAPLPSVEPERVDNKQSRKQKSAPVNITAQAESSLARRASRPARRS